MLSKPRGGFLLAALEPPGLREEKALPDLQRFSTQPGGKGRGEDGDEEPALFQEGRKRQATARSAPG